MRKEKTYIACTQLYNVHIASNIYMSGLILYQCVWCWKIKKIERSYLREDKATISSIVPKLPAIPRKFYSKETFKWFVPVTWSLMFCIPVQCFSSRTSFMCQSVVKRSCFRILELKLIFYELVVCAKWFWYVAKAGCKFACFLRWIPFPFQINLSQDKIIIAMAMWCPRWPNVAKIVDSTRQCFRPKHLWTLVRKDFMSGLHKYFLSISIKCTTILSRSCFVSCFTAVWESNKPQGLNSYRGALSNWGSCFP